MITRLREYIYLPNQLEYTIPILLGLVTSVILATTDYSSTSTTWPPAGRDWDSYLLLTVLLLSLNGLLLWGHIRNYYLTWSTAWVPVCTSLTIISTLYILFYGLTLLLKGRVTLATDLSDINLQLTLYCSVGALSSMVPFMTFPALWKPSSDTLEHLRESRTQLLETLRKLSSDAKISEDDKLLIIESVLTIVESDPKTEVLLHSKRDRRILRKWKRELGEIVESMDRKMSAEAYSDFLIRNNRYQKMIESLENK